jgi:hypothetical protein
MNHELDHERDQAHGTNTRSTDISVPGRSSASATLASPTTPVPSGIVRHRADSSELGVSESLVQFVSATHEDATSTATPETVKHVAAKGVEGSGSQLPHLEQIQKSFGPYDVSGVKAHVGGDAAFANQRLGGEAYAMGNNIAFGAAPSLHTAAHEAAHVVQQRAGVQIAGGVGQAGDTHERHADAVADAVVGGANAAELLDQGGEQVGGEQVLQFKRPNPTPIDSGMSTAADSIAMSGDAFGHNDWKKEVDWKGMGAWLTKVNASEQRLTATINPTVDRDLTTVEQCRDEYKLRLHDAFEKERPQIEHMVATDSDVRQQLEEISTSIDAMKNKFTEKSAALTDVDVAADLMAAAASHKQAKAAEGEKGKASTNLAGVKANKDAALAALMEIPTLIKGAIDLGKDVAKKGPGGVAVDKAKGIAETLILSAYKGWAEKEVADKYDVTIKNLQFKIRGLQSQIEALEDEEAAARAKAAAGQAKSAAFRVQAADGEIARLMKHVAMARKTLSITVEQKYKDLSVFKLSHEATEAMKMPLANYLISLNESKACLATFQPWRQYHSQLSAISMKVQGLDYLPDGDAPGKGTLPQLGAPKKTPAQEAVILRTVAQINQFTSWLNRFGFYTESEQMFVDSEIEKVQSGGYLDFIQEIEAKIAAML